MAVMGETPGLNATEIVTRTAMDKVAISRTVASLIKLGYAKGEASQEDGRQSLLYLTRKGRGDELNRLLGKLAKVASPDRALW